MKVYHITPALLLFTLISAFSLKSHQEKKAFPTAEAMWNVFYLPKQPILQYIYKMTGNSTIKYLDDRREIGFGKLTHDSNLSIEKNKISNYKVTYNKVNCMCEISPLLIPYGFNLYRIKSEKIISRTVNSDTYPLDIPHLEPEVSIYSLTTETAKQTVKIIIHH